MAVPAKPDAWWEARAVPLEAASTPWTGPDEPLTLLETRAGGWWVDEPLTVDQVAALQSGGAVTEAGAAISTEAMLGVATAFGCVRVIGEDVGKLPRRLFRREPPRGGGRPSTVRADDDPRFDLLYAAPNDWMTGQELIEFMVGQAALHGTAYAYLNRDADGFVDEILPLLPGRCRPRQVSDWSIVYDLTGYGETQALDPAQVWRLNGFMLSPLGGANVSRFAREAIGLAAAIEGSQARFHGADARPSGTLTTKTGGLTREKRERVRDDWNTAYGRGGRGGIAVLDGDWEFKTIAMTAADGQVIENRTFQIEEICRFFRVHPWAIMRQNSSQSYGSLEQTARAHLEQTLMPWVTRVEQTVRRDVLNRARMGPDGTWHVDRASDRQLFLKLNVDAIARATFSDRVNGYANAVKVYLTPNEIRELEDRDPLDLPEMDRVQLLANNTGLPPGGGARPGASTSGQGQPATAPAAADPAVAAEAEALMGKLGAGSRAAPCSPREAEFLAALERHLART